MPRPLSTLTQQMEERKSRKRIQNRMAQRLYRQRQRQRIEESKAKLAAQHENFPECANSIAMIRYRSRSNSSASRQNVCHGGLASVRRDPFFAVSDEQCTSCSDSPMFSGHEDPGNEDIGELHTLQNHSADLSSSFAPIAVMSVAGPQVWSCDAISDLNIIDPEALFDFNFNHGMEMVPLSPMNSPSCGNTGVDSASRPSADQQGPPAYSIQSHTSDSLSTSGVNMLKDLFSTGSPQTQRHPCTVESCTIPAVSSEDGQRYDGTQTNEPLLLTRSPSAAIIDALLSSCAQLTDIPCLEIVEQQSNGDRRLPRVIASVRRALQEWRDWEKDGFPLD